MMDGPAASRTFILRGSLRAAFYRSDAEASKDGRPGCIEAFHPSRLAAQCICTAQRAPQDDGVERARATPRSRAPDAAQRPCGALQSRGPSISAYRVAIWG